MKEKITIGRKDKGDLPEFDLKNIDIKIDTGAYTSAIHCHKIGIKVVDGKEVVSFMVLDPSHQQYGDKEFIAENFKEKRIKSSNGTSERRFVIRTSIRLFGKRYSIELSLSERGEMRFPILIGRKFLMGKFIVNPSEYDLSHKRKLLLKEYNRKLLLKEQKKNLK